MIKFENRKLSSLACALAMVALLAAMPADAATKKKKKNKPAKLPQNEQLIKDAEEGKRTGPDLDPIEGASNPITSGVGQTGGVSAPIPEKIEDEIRNKRLKTLDGSKSPFSGQFQLGYSGASIQKPWSDEVPNPGNEQPVPLATLSGNVSARYRIDPRTSVGIGTGLLVYAPFQRFERASVSDPYVDFGRSYKLGPIQGRGSASVSYYTNAQSRNDFGYRWGFGASNEAFYEFPFGLLTGLSLQANFNTFADGNFPKGIADPQPELSFNVAPYLEYRLNDTLNLRSVTGFQFYRFKGETGGFKLTRIPVYQTVGLGIAATDSIFFYPYIRYFFAKLNTADTTFGFSAIINLF